MITHPISTRTLTLCFAILLRNALHHQDILLIYQNIRLYMQFTMVMFKSSFTAYAYAFGGYK